MPKFQSNKRLLAAAPQPQTPTQPPLYITCPMISAAASALQPKKRARALGAMSPSLARSCRKYLQKRAVLLSARQSAPEPAAVGRGRAAALRKRLLLVQLLLLAHPGRVSHRNRARGRSCSVDAGAGGGGRNYCFSRPFFPFFCVSACVIDERK